MESYRLLKRMIVGACILLGIFAVVWLFVDTTPEPTCSDGIRNQDEAQTDCGGVCSPCERDVAKENISILETGAIRSTNTQVDVFARIQNPNELYGASQFLATFLLYDQDGEVIAQREHQGYILPRQEKYLIELAFDVVVEPSRVDVLISEVSWEHFSTFEEPKFSSFNKRFDVKSSSMQYAEVYAVVRNESRYDFSSVEVNIVLSDTSGNILALHKTQIGAVKSNEERDFRLSWPEAFAGSVTKIDIYPESNVFDNDNYMRIYLPSSSASFR